MLFAFLYFLLAISLLGLAFALNALLGMFRDKVPYVTTPDWAIEWLCDNLPLLPSLSRACRGKEGVSRSDGGGGSPLPLQRGGARGGVSPPPYKGGGRGVVYDLGCGDARVLLALKRKFPTIKAIGYERGWWPYLLARFHTRNTGVEVRRSSFYQANLKDADMIFCFLIQSVMPRVERLLRTQLKPGTIVYSYGFSFPTWQTTQRIVNPKKPEGSKINVYLQ